MSDLRTNAETSQTLPVAGWYDDPSGSGQLRWWGGLAWTEYVKPREQPVPREQPAPARAPEPSYIPAGSTYVPFAVTYAPSPVRLESSGSSGTLAAWLMGSYPLIAVVGQWLILQAGRRLDPVSLVAVPLLLLVVVVGSAIWDSALLRRRGFDAPSAWWILLGPLAYLIARVVALRHSGARSAGPLILLVLAAIIASIVSVLVVAPLLLSAQNDDLIDQFETRVEQGLAAQSPGAWEVTCSRDASITTVGSSVPCSATNQTGVAVSFVVTVGQDGQLSVSEPTPSSSS